MARFLFLVLMMGLSPSSAFAHGLIVNCKLVGSKVEVSVFYDDDTDAAKAKVQVMNAKNEVVAEGVANEKGRWSFDVPQAGKYVVHADAGAGHRAKKDLDVSGANSAPPESVATGKSTPVQYASKSIGSATENQKPTTTPSPVQMSEGPSREELTRTPWLKIAIGVTVIGACSGAFVIAMRVRKK